MPTTDPPANPKVNVELKAAIDTLLADRPVAYHPLVARAVGSVTAGVLLAQFLYWAPRSQDQEGWFYKTREEIVAETALTRSEQETARKKLVQVGVLEEKLRKVPAKMHYRLNMERLTALLAANPDAGPPTGGGEPPQQVGGNPANWPAAMPPTITETSAESTTVPSLRMAYSHGEQEGNHTDTADREAVAHRGIAHIAEVLAKRHLRPIDGSAAASAQPATPTATRTTALTEQEQTAIAAYLRDAARDLGDQAPAERTLSRVSGLFQAAGLPLATFLNRLYTAHHRTVDRHGERPLEWPFAFFLTVLEDDLGLRRSRQRPDIRVAKRANEHGPVSRSAAPKTARPTEDDSYSDVPVDTLVGPASAPPHTDDSF